MATARDRRNVAVLATCQVLFGTGRTLIAATAPIIGFALASNKSLATLPTSMVVLGTALTVIPASLFMRRVGRGPGFSVGGLLGAVGGTLGVIAVLTGHFWLFCLGTLMFGCMSGFAQNYRFAAADVASPDFRAQAISLVLAAGVISAFTGPELAKLGKDLIGSVPFLGTYILLIVVTLTSSFVVRLVDIPKLSGAEQRETGRPVLEIMLQPAFIAATMCAIAGYAVMSLLMTATPLAMVQLHHQFHDAAMVIEWHVFAMFAPGFLTGKLIRRFGVLTIVTIGLVLLTAAVCVGLSGTGVVQFWAAMFLLGLGWNFTFTGGTTMITEVHTPAERAKTQAANNFLIFGIVAVASLMSGTILNILGWTWVNVAALPLICAAAIAVAWLGWFRRHRTEGMPAE